MAQYSRIHVIKQMEESGMVPLFYHSDIKVVKSVVKACYDGGTRLIEFTNSGDLAIDIFSELMSYVISELPTMIVGVGSVTDAESASRYMMARANFVVTPVFRNDIAVVCNRRKVLWGTWMWIFD
jgi:2-dehydro-3-deoxyphosphogluconate aldolase/(4S)-4-hydroxy-2-oxoglutarate aldolase